MSIFAMAVDAGFNVYGVDATYTPPGGDPVAVRVITKRADTATAFATVAVRLSPGNQAIAVIADVRRAEVETPVRGAVLEIDGQSYDVAEVELDETRLVWHLALKVKRS